MSRVSMFSSPLLLGFDQLERTLERLAKNAEGYPPYNIERIGEDGLRITLAVGHQLADHQAQADHGIARPGIGRHREEALGAAPAEAQGIEGGSQ